MVPSVGAGPGETHCARGHPCPRGAEARGGSFRDSPSPPVHVTARLSCSQRRLRAPVSFMLSDGIRSFHVTWRKTPRTVGCQPAWGLEGKASAGASVPPDGRGHRLPWDVGGGSDCQPGGRRLQGLASAGRSAGRPCVRYLASRSSSVEWGARSRTTAPKGAVS